MTATSRVQSSEPSLRVRMGWLHAWVGFVGGLLLVCIFATGALAVFDTELTHWMQPEAIRASAAAPSAAALDRAAREVESHEGGRGRIFLALPSARDPMLHVSFMDRGILRTRTFDPRTGDLIPLRDTAGGLLFFSFHYTLHMGHVTGVIFVQALAIAMMVTLGSGLIIHLKALLPGLVTFRPHGKSPRPWIDAHVLAAVLFLPFLFMMAYTGVLIHANRLFPGTAMEERAREGRPAGGPLAPLPPLAPILEDASRVFGAADQAGFLMFSPKTVSVVRGDGANGVGISRDRVEYDRITGQRLKLVRKNSGPARTSQFLVGLHMARWAPVSMRWLYFLGGLAGYAMFATGLVMFLLKRRAKAGERQTAGMRIAEGLALGTVLGMPVACVGVLWLNRLVPASLPLRVTIEEVSLLAIWFLTVVHALARTGAGGVMKGWREQAVLLAGLLLLLPVLDVATRWRWMSGQDQEGYLAVDAVALIFGVAAFYLCRILRRKEERGLLPVRTGASEIAGS